jgi:hypothetical protein
MKLLLVLFLGSLSCNGQSVVDSISQGSRPTNFGILTPSERQAQANSLAQQRAETELLKAKTEELRLQNELHAKALQDQQGTSNQVPKRQTTPDGERQDGLATKMAAYMTHEMPNGRFWLIMNERSKGAFVMGYEQAIMFSQAANLTPHQEDVVVAQDASTPSA